MSSILVVGSGGREHALSSMFLGEGRTVYVAPGNGGTLNNVSIQPNDFEGLAAFAEKHSAFTVVGPEEPFDRGIVNYFEKRELPIYGPRQNAAIIESSKAFSKNLMRYYGIPTPRYKVVSNIEGGIHALDSFEPPYVIKKSGLAAGKGVSVVNNKNDAVSVLKLLLEGSASEGRREQVVIEEFLAGDEASYFVIVDEKGNFVPMLSVRDYKKRDDGDLGPNTGGMGSYAPHELITPRMEEKILKSIIRPTINGMIKEGRPFTGTLYAGLMISEGEPYVLEFNCRFGDPETQNLAAMTESALFPYLESSVYGGLKQMPRMEWTTGSSVNVVMASEGYPISPKTGRVIYGLNKTLQPDVRIFHAGTKEEGCHEFLYTNGGRVLNVVAVGEDIDAARKKAYEAVEGIKFDGMFYRKDIGRIAAGVKRP